MTTELRRSWLFAPGNEPRKMAKALMAGADQVVFDLEDAVPQEHKEEALAAILKMSNPKEFYVRINGLESDRCYKEISSLVAVGIKGLVVPKMENGNHCAIINWMINALEQKHKIAIGTTDIVPVIETAQGFSLLQEICAHKGRIKRLSFGAWDLCWDTNMRYHKSEEMLIMPRYELVVASRAADMEAPIDTSYIYLQDEEGLKASIARAQDLGYQGKACIHLEQLTAVNEGFSPSDEEYISAAAMVKAFEEALAQGSASARLGNQFIDYPLYYRAQQIVAMSELIKQAAQAKNVNYDKL